MEQNCYRKGGDEGEEIESKFILKKNIKSDRDKKNKAFNTKFNTKGWVYKLHYGNNLKKGQQI